MRKLLSFKIRIIMRYDQKQKDGLKPILVNNFYGNK